MLFKVLWSGTKFIVASNYVNVNKIKIVKFKWSGAINDGCQYRKENIKKWTAKQKSNFLERPGLSLWWRGNLTVTKFIGYKISESLGFFPVVKTTKFTGITQTVNSYCIRFRIVICHCRLFPTLTFCFSLKRHIS